MNFAFRCLKTKSDRQSPDPQAVGLDKASPESLKAWEADEWAQAPCEYDSSNMVMDCAGDVRRLLLCEEEVLADQLYRI